jgi:hypothetical protein
MIITNTKLTESTKFVIENIHSTSDTNTVTMTAKVRNAHSSDSRLEFYSDGYGDFYLFGGYMMSFALIQADSFESAHEIYMEEFVPCDDMDGEEFDEYGAFDGNGGFYNECTMSNIVALNADDYTFDFDIQSN